MNEKYYLKAIEVLGKELQSKEVDVLIYESRVERLEKALEDAEKEIERLEEALESAEQEIESLRNGSYDEIRK
jgi:multidrug resistance efflux pump